MNRFFNYKKENVSVIVIDDNEVTLKMTSMILEKHVKEVFQIHVKKETSVAEIIQKIKRLVDTGHVIKFVLTDVEMPVSVEEMASKIHEIFPDLPIAAITSSDEEEINALDKRNIVLVMARPFVSEKWDKVCSEIRKIEQESNKSYLLLK